MCMLASSESPGSNIEKYLAGPPGTATPYWLLFERYMDYMREQRDANGGVIENTLKPPDVAVNAYFMALAA